MKKSLAFAICFLYYEVRAKQKGGENELQNRLKAIRQANKKKAEDMARLIGITTDSYTKKENGHYQFKLNEMFMIAQEFNMRVDDVFSFTLREEE